MSIRTAKTEAIALRTIEVTNTSAIVVWLTRDHGRLATMIKGAYRPKSLFLGQFDLFYTCELVYYLHAREHLHAIRECSPLKIRSALRSDWRACAAASYICDLLGKITPWGARYPELFQLLALYLDQLHENGLALQSLYWFELRLLQMQGVTPRLDQCSLCAKAIGADEDNTLFSSEHGGIVCRDCGRVRGDGCRSVSNGSLAILRNWYRSADYPTANRTQLNDRQAKEIQWLLGDFLEHHLDCELGSRRVAFEIFA